MSGNIQYNFIAVLAIAPYTIQIHQFLLQLTLVLIVYRIMPWYAMNRIKHFDKIRTLYITFVRHIRTFLAMFLLQISWCVYRACNLLGKQL